MIKALIFDINGTLDADLPIKLAAMQKALKTAGIGNPTILARKILVDIERIDLGNPSMGMSEIVYGALDRLGIRDSLKRRICRVYDTYRHSGDDISESVMLIMPRLAKHYVLFLYSLSSRESVDSWLKRHKIGKYFSKIYTAQDSGIEKPSVDALELILKENGLKGNECVMVGDDVTKDMLPAKLIGMKTVLLSSIVDHHIKQVRSLMEVLSK